MNLVPPKPRVLYVDDDFELLDGLRNALADRFDVSIAGTGPQALARFDGADDPPFDVVVADLDMPDMTGTTLLTILAERHPELPRLLLTAHPDVESAMAAINEAGVFRYLVKPCSPEVLAAAIDDALVDADRWHRHRELAERTLDGAVDLLAGLVDLISPEASNRSTAITHHVQTISLGLGRPVGQTLERAAILSNLGHIVAPQAIDEDPAQAERRVELAAELLIRVPRLEQVAAIIRGQLASEPLSDATEIDRWADRELDAEILRLAVRFESLVAAGFAPTEATAALETEWDGSDLLSAALGRLQSDNDQVEVDLELADLRPGMMLVDELRLLTGPVLAPAGMELTVALIGRIESFARDPGVEQPVRVRMSAAVVDLPVGRPS